MEKDKVPGLGSQKSEDFRDEATTTRARNRTVMLTPDITGEVRARLAKEMDTPASSSGAFSSPSSGGFTPAMSRDHETRGGGTPATVNTPSTPPAAVMNGAHTFEITGVSWRKKSRIVGFLVSYDKEENGEVFDLRSGRLIVTCEPAANSDYLLITEGNVSPLHAILRISPTGEIQVLDQLSEHGTRLTKFGSESTVELSGDKAALEHGDIIQFGERTFYVCIITRGV